MQEKRSRDDYEKSKEWQRDWQKLNDLSWQREIEIHALRVLHESYEQRLKAQSMKHGTWEPDDRDGMHEDE